MIYTAEEIDAFARWASEKGHQNFTRSHPKSFTLAAAIELACRRERMEPSPARDLVDSWSRDHHELRHAQSLLGTSVPCAISESPDAVWISLPKPDSVTSNAHPLFLRRFTDSLKAAGFSVNLACALAGALEAMTDNLAQHSFDAGHLSGGLAAFRIRRRAMAFVVADLGRGALNSLRDNPAWSGLDSDHAAVRAIVVQHASRRAGLGEGEGFKTLFRGLAALNGELRFRSGSATYEIKGSLDSVHGTAAFSEAIPGLLMAVRCRL